MKPYIEYKEKMLPLAAKLELCRRNPADFFSFITGFKPNDHQVKILEILKNLPDDGRLIVSCPPRHGKTECVSKIFPPWLMGNAQLRDINQKVGIFTYGQKYSNDVSLRARQYIQSPYYNLVFPDVKLSGEAVEKWRFDGEKDISYTASSVGGVATGMGFNLIVIDDAIKDWEEARNRDRTEKIYDWFQSVAATRAEKGCKIVIIATRWSDHDLTGRLLGSNEYEYINFPAIDSNGNALWESQFPLEHLEKIREARGGKVWSTLYQGNPIPDEGQIIKPEHIRYGKPTRPSVHSLISWDTASKIGEPNDYSVGIEMEKDDIGNIFITNIIRIKQEFPDMVRTVATWGTSPNIYIEDKSSGIQLIQQLKRECKRNIIPVKSVKSKLFRLESVTPLFEANKVFFADEYLFSIAITELLSFPDGSFDDTVDAISQGLIELTKSNKVSSGVSKDSLMKQSVYGGLF